MRAVIQRVEEAWVTSAPDRGRPGEEVGRIGPGLVVLVGQEMDRDPDPPHGRPRDAGPPEAARQPVPVHRVAAEDAGQRPEGDAEGPQEQRALDVGDAGPPAPGRPRPPGGGP